MIQRVAAYCRVSTDTSDQANSLASQERYFREYISRNPQWELVQVFVDTGITGTSTKKRDAFNQMISEACAGRFQMILTKEISRFARNTLDSIYYTRKLKAHGISVIFMNDNINTMDPDAELRLTIMSSIAQEESRKTSDRVKWGQKRRMEQGVVFGRDLLGYDVRGGRLYINKEGAEIVRLIFHKFVNEGKGTHTIARELREAGIPTSAYMKQWSNTAILRILRNEKAAGDLIQKKTITPNYLTHEKKYNKGEEEFVVIRNHHEPIIPREMFDRAARELARRSPSPEKKAKHSNRYCFSGKLKCGICGSSYVSRSKKRKDGSVYKSWRCSEAAKYGTRHIDNAGNQAGCCCPSVNDENLKQIMMKIIASLSMDNDAILEPVIRTITDIMQNQTTPETGKAAEEKAEAILQKKKRLIELYLSKDITKDEFQQMKKKYDEDITVIRQEIISGHPLNELLDRKQAVPEDISRFLSGLITGECWNDTFYRTLLRSITVAEDNTLIICLNCHPGIWKAVPCRHFGSSPPISVSSPATSL